MILSRGQRDKLSKFISVSSPVTIQMSINGSSVYDFCCFGVDGSGKLSDDRYMVFYNQPTTPNGEIIYTPSNHSADFVVNLSALPSTIEKLVFTASIDGDGVMGNITNHSFHLIQNGTPALSMELSGSDFNQEKAIICVELYKKEEWRINAVANGFNGGLSALLAAYGGTEVSDSSQQIQPVPNSASAPMNTPASSVTVTAPSANSPIVSTRGVVLKKTEEQLTKEVMGKINLSKDKANLEKHVVNLSKTVINISKKSGVDLGSLRAQVVVALDYSGSMDTLYNNGIVQKTINRLVPLGLTFDDNGTIDVYLFQNNYKKINDLTLSNYENYVKNVVRCSGYSMGGTNYAPVIKAIIEGGVRYTSGFLGLGAQRETITPLVNDETPTFIIFITDGENADRNACDEIIRKSSDMNVFIQFIGIGNERFTYLESLDNLSGRKRDNTGFSAMRSLNNASDEELYTNVLDQFSQWLRGLQ